MRRLLIAYSALLVSCDVFPGGGSSAFPPTITMAATVFGTGSLSVSGTVTLPPFSSSGKFVQLYVERSAGTGGGTQIQGSVQTTSSHEVDYEITGLPSGDYKIRLAVDESGNGVFSETGDYEGWYDGTLTSPKQSAGSAATIVLVSVSRTGMNFGVGEL
ncbi:MAG TPA: hypothetical protein VFV50_14085 [Bdellovibrionales bacterium]|nr:hypothetical protein [Bdellovibrionales bacterium]